MCLDDDTVEYINKPLYVKINNYLEQMGFDYNAVSIYDALKRYYFGDEELRKSIDKLFARFYNKKYSADMSNVMLDYCCGFTDGENRKEPSIAIQAALAVTVNLAYCVKDSKKMIELLHLFFEKKRVILWTKLNNHEYISASLPLDTEYDLTVNFVSSFKTSKIYINKADGEIRYYTKKVSGKWLQNFNPDNSDVIANYNELYDNLYAIRKISSRNTEVTRSTCNWCAPLGTINRANERCPNCEKIYNLLSQLNSNRRRYKTNREISQNIKRKINSPKSPKTLLEAALIEFREIYTFNNPDFNSMKQHSEYEIFKHKIEEYCK